MMLLVKGLQLLLYQAGVSFLERLRNHYFCTLKDTYVKFAT